MVWMSNQCYMMYKVTINQDIIKPNLPLEGRVDFKKTQVSNRIICTMTAREQPSISSIKAIKDKHGKKKHDNSQNNRNNQKKNMCQIKGHDHEWKYFPDNPSLKARSSQDGTRESHATQRTRDKSQDSRAIEYESSYMEEGLQNDNRFQYI